MRNGYVMAARARHGGPMRDTRFKRLHSWQDEWEDEYQDSMTRTMQSRYDTEMPNPHHTVCENAFRDT